MISAISILAHQLQILVNILCAFWAAAEIRNGHQHAPIVSPTRVSYSHSNLELVLNGNALMSRLLRLFSRFQRVENEAIRDSIQKWMQILDSSPIEQHTNVCIENLTENWDASDLLFIFSFMWKKSAVMWKRNVNIRRCLPLWRQDAWSS